MTNERDDEICPFGVLMSNRVIDRPVGEERKSARSRKENTDMVGYGGTRKGAVQSLLVSGRLLEERDNIWVMDYWKRVGSARSFC